MCTNQSIFHQLKVDDEGFLTPQKFDLPIFLLYFGFFLILSFIQIFLDISDYLDFFRIF